MKVKTLLFLVFFFTVQLLKSQTNFQSGYIIKLSGDTLNGEIDNRGDILMSQVCRFRINNKGNETKYLPSDIGGFRFSNDKYYISKNINGKDVFVEFLIKGKINIYYKRDYDGDHYFLEKDSFKIVEIPYSEKLINIDGKVYLEKSTIHIGLLNVYMQDAIGFQSRIESIGKPEHDNLIKLAEEYHNAVCKDNSCVIYEKKLPSIRFSFEPIVGLDYFNPTFSTFGNPLKYGANVFIWMPLVNENLSFKTGFIADKYINKIPLQVQYLYPPSIIIRPKFCIGTNLYFGNNVMVHTLHLGSGFIFKLDKNVYFSTNVSAEFTPPLSYFSSFGVIVYSFDVGLYFEL